MMRNLYADRATNRYKENDLYLSGESYAGIYVPTLAREIHTKSGPGSSHPLKLKGFACGDCVLGRDP